MEASELTLQEISEQRFNVRRNCDSLNRKTHYRYMQYSEELNNLSLFKYENNKHIDLGMDEKFRRFTYVMMSPVPTVNTICCDASCINNGREDSVGSFKIVRFETDETLYESHAYYGSTNNMMEYMALLKTMIMCKRNGWDYDIYTDSLIAMYWLYQNTEKSKLKDWMDSIDLEQLDHFENMVYSDKSSFRNRIFFWDNQFFGEIPADLDGKYKPRDRDYQVRQFINGEFIKDKISKK